MRPWLPMTLLLLGLVALPGCPGTPQIVYVYVTPTPGTDAAPMVAPPAGEGTATPAPDAAATPVAPTPAPGAAIIVYVTPTPGVNASPTPSPIFSPPDIGMEGEGPAATVNFPPEPPASAFALPTAPTSTLKAGGTFKITGRVTNLLTNRGVAGAWVSIVSPEEHAERADVLTASDGAFTVTGVPAGGYYVRAQKAGAVGSQAPVFVSATYGDVTGVNFVLHAP